MKKQTPSNIGATVMKSIKSGEAKMKPRAYFTLLGVISMGAVVLFGLAATYLSSIMFFWLRVQTAGTMAYGARAKLGEAIASFPWWALIVATLLMVLAIILVRRQGKLYKHKTGTIALLLITTSLIIGLALSFMGVGQTHIPNQSGEWRQNQGWQRNR